MKNQIAVFFRYYHRKPIIKYSLYTHYIMEEIKNSFTGSIWIYNYSMKLILMILIEQTLKKVGFHRKQLH